MVQIAIYLYCRAQLALLHHLQGIGLRWLSPPQPALIAWKYNENGRKPIKFMKIHVLASIGNVQACPHPAKPSSHSESNGNHKKAMRIHILASIGNVQASPHPPKPSNPPGINKNEKIVKIHVLASIGKVKAPPPLQISRNL